MKTLTISSSHNEHFKALKQLLEPKGIKKQKRFLVSGAKVVSEVLKAKPEIVHSLLVPEGENIRAQVPLTILAQNLFAEIDQFGTHQTIAVCHLPELPTFDSSAPRGLEVVLTQGDPSNLGAALRSSVALGCTRVILTKEAASPFHPRAIRASSGAWIKAPLCAGPALNELSDLVILDMKGQNIHQFAWPKNVRLMVGEEGPGVPDAIEGQRVYIPLKGEVESLNATVALSMALFSYRGQHS